MTIHMYICKLCFGLLMLKATINIKIFKGGVDMLVVEKEDLQIEANSKLAMVFALDNEAEVGSGYLEYTEYNACVFCIT